MQNLAKNLTLTLTSIGLGILTFYFTQLESVKNLDVAVNSYLAHRTPTGSVFGLVLKDVSDYGSIYLTALVLTLTISIIFVYYKQVKLAAFVVASNLSVIYGIYLKLLFDRLRPASASMSDVFNFYTLGSFPSLHVLYYTVFWGFLIYISFQKVKIPRFILMTFRWVGFYLILFIGLSRIYLMVHWPTDVLSGYLFGFSFLLLFITVVQVLELKSAK